MIDENGMDRLVVIVIAFMYEMEHNNVDPDLAYAVNWHIEDFEKGDYERAMVELKTAESQTDVKKDELEVLIAEIDTIQGLYAILLL